MAREFPFLKYGRDRAFVIRCFQWEFLRRNPKYQKDYRECERALAAVKKHSSRETNLRFIKADAAIKRWKLEEILDPALPPPSHPHQVLSDPNYQSFMSLSPVRPITTWYTLTMRNGKLDSQMKSIEELWRIRTVKVEFDLTASTGEIVKAFTQIVEDWKRLQMNLFPHRRPRIRIAALADCIRIYDLREDEHKTFREIASIVRGSSGKTTDRDQESTVYKSYLTARELVNGGFRNISA